MTSSTTTFTVESRMLIDGKLVESSSGATFANINPATEEVIGHVADGTAEDMRTAIAAARRAFDETDWSTNKELRKRCLQQFQDAIDAEIDEIREEIIAEAGAPRKLTYGPQVDQPVNDGLRYPIKMIDEFEWERALPDGKTLVGGGSTARNVWKEAIGVVGAIVPWNFPLDIALGKIGAILGTGNTVVLKPAPDTPFNATRLGRLAAEKTDIPAGVFNVVTSSDHLVGEELTLSPLVDMISFTGSTATGKRIMEKGAATLKKVSFELGGKSAMIVLEDADFEAVVPNATTSCIHAGQGCALQTRLLLPRSRYDEGVAIITRAIAELQFGDPNESDVLMGPLINARQRDKVLGYIEQGKAEGAKLVVGGGKPAGYDKGFYVEPTLFIDVDNSMVIAQEEIFGPVLCVIPYDDDDDAVAIANDSPYGLSGGVYSGSLERAQSVARRVRTGTLTINCAMPFGPDIPFGGSKMSGIGRQNGIEGFEHYLETKSVGWLR